MGEKKEESSAAWNKVTSALPILSLITSSVAICMMVLLVVSGVVARIVFNYNIPFAIEYTEYLIPIIVFWGAAYTLEQEGHINVGILIDRLPEKIRSWMEVIGYIVGLIFLIIMIKSSFQLAITSFRENYTSMYSTKTPLGYVQIFAPIGLSLFAMQLVIQIIRKVGLGNNDPKKQSIVE